MSLQIKADIGIIGGTGIYNSDILENKQEFKISTPFGSPSDIISLGDYKGKKIAFIPRHGKNHSIPPHKINSRANIWALKELGVSRIIAPSAVGSLQPKFKPGDFVVPDQFIDFTKKREYTFYDGNRVCHISSADPFCHQLREIAVSCCRTKELAYHENGTYICIEGPRFSTRAESKFFKEIIGGHIIGMTLVPECILAKEMQICYLSLSSVTDYDVWAENPVSSKEIIETLKKNAIITQKLLIDLINDIPKQRSCMCGNSLDDALL